MNRRRFRPGDTSGGGLSAQFDQRLHERLAIADARRQRHAALLRLRRRAIFGVPLVCAGCWALLPFTFGNGIRALTGFLGYVTMLLAMAHGLNGEYLSYLGLSPVPVVIDLLLLIGVVSWLMSASSADEIGSPADLGAGDQQ
jgi:hypothetical protein